MSHLPRYATLIDGAFAIRKLEARLHAFPTANHIQALPAAIGRDECVRGLSRLRVYFYHARPATQIVTNPISKCTIALAETRVHADHARLLAELEPRRISLSGWARPIPLDGRSETARSAAFCVSLA